jgi:peptidoglycan/LPS O-acetylase OafA/YrhL
MPNSPENHRTGHPREANRIDVLDGWRTFSVSLVIVSHVLIWSSLSIGGYQSVEARQIFTPLIEGLGYVGVEIFFVISGFVICRGLLRELETFHRISLSAFYVRRSFRILPPLLLYVTVIFLLSKLHLIDSDARSIFEALTFTCNIPLGSCGGWWGAHTWSLSVEEQFYLVIPLVISLLSTYRVVALTSILVLFAVLLLMLELLGQSDIGHFVSNFLAIGVGVVCALHERRVRDFAGSWPNWVFYGSLVGLIILARLHNTRYWTIATVALAPLIAYLLFASMSNSSLATKVLNMGPVRAVGKASYGLYLWQQLATAAFPDAGIVFYTISICGCILFVLVLFSWMERPIIRLGAKISRALQTSALSAIPTSNFHPLLPQAGNCRGSDAKSDARLTATSSANDL